MSQLPSYGPVTGPPVGEISRRNFLRRVLGVGVGILSLEFLGGTFAFLWPNLTLKKIPKMVLARCEWGHDDYSLEVSNLAPAPPPSGQQGLGFED